MKSKSNYLLTRPEKPLYFKMSLYNNCGNEQLMFITKTPFKKYAGKRRLTSVQIIGRFFSKNWV